MKIRYRSLCLHISLSMRLDCVALAAELTRRTTGYTAEIDYEGIEYGRYQYRLICSTDNEERIAEAITQIEQDIQAAQHDRRMLSLLYQEPKLGDATLARIRDAGQQEPEECDDEDMPF